MILLADSCQDGKLSDEIHYPIRGSSDVDTLSRIDGCLADKLAQ